jgi:hypothetical protein
VIDCAAAAANRAIQPERRFLASAAINGDLDGRQQFGCVLNLVAAHGRLEALQREFWTGRGQRPRSRVVAGNVVAVLPGQVLRQRGLADLPRSGQQPNRELLRRVKAGWADGPGQVPA